MTGNGHDGQKYDGDGVELDSSGALVTGNRIEGNGDSAGFEHGIYAGSAARGYTIVGNSIEGNAGADIKAAGGPALVTGNRLRTSLFGVVVSDNPAVVTVQYNLIQGRFQHGILVTTGRHSSARARFWNNTVEQTGRLSGTGNASAVFVVSAGLLALRNNLFAYTNPDGLGQAIMIDSAALVGSFTASSNWYANTDPAKRRLAWNGSLVTLGEWRRLSGQDASSIASPAPRFGPAGRVVSRNLGAARGMRLGLVRDLAGTRVGSPRASRHRRLRAPLLSGTARRGRPVKDGPARPHGWGAVVKPAGRAAQRLSGVGFEIAVSAPGTDATTRRLPRSLGLRMVFENTPLAVA